MSELQAENAALKRERAALKRERDTLRRERAAVRRERDALKRERDALKENVVSLEARLQTAESQMWSASLNAMDMRNSYERTSRKLEALIRVYYMHDGFPQEALSDEDRPLARLRLSEEGEEGEPELPVFQRWAPKKEAEGGAEKEEGEEAAEEEEEGEEGEGEAEEG